ncbi:MAG TPA: type VII secretion-associated serine protease mycosin [Actinoplanes sp.]|nr:type VII secretion-associated serine protease mycosin [Actinoplanes sp.]
MQVGKRSAALAAVCATIALTSSPAAAAPVGSNAAGCETRPQSQQTAPPGLVPHAQTRFGLDRLQPFADGRGIRIAVIDSGVDATHPQLRGRVDAGRDFLRSAPDGRRDCNGHGTGVASLIAAQPVAGRTLRGLAPAATIVPVRVSELEATDPNATGPAVRGESVGPREFAAAIDWAAATGPGKGNATVLNVSSTMPEDPEVRAAVRRAIAAGVVIVAAAGNEAGRGNPVPYPAAYPGVIGVGAVNQGGTRLPSSQQGGYVDVVAPGDQILAANERRGYQLTSGTSFAAPFVAATAALIQQRFPGLSPEQVQRRIVQTADPAPGGPVSEAYGHGVLNPYRALTETLAPADRPAARQVLPPADPALAAAAQHERQAWSTALLIAAAGAAAAIAVSTVAVVVRRGRRRGWRPAGTAGGSFPPPTG